MSMEIDTYLQKWRCSGKDDKYEKSILNWASEQGYVAVLDWWYNLTSKSQLKYTRFAIHSASSNGHIAVLDWWKNKSILDSIELKYNKFVLYYASEKGQLSVLYWWIDSGLEIEIDGMLLVLSSNIASNIEIVNWWKNLHHTYVYHTELTPIDIECSVCYETLKNGKSIQLECNHCFHLECINQWQNNTCPYCRAPFKKRLKYKIEIVKVNI